MVLERAGRFGVSKGDMLGKFWRNFDQLERKGLICRHYAGVYKLTDAGAVEWDLHFANQQLKQES